jgi:hypothetical protein
MIRGPWENGTTYYWRIDEKNANGTTTGDVWSFTTQSVPGRKRPYQSLSGIQCRPCAEEYPFTMGRSPVMQPLTG